MLLRPNLIITTVFASLLGSSAGFAAITAEDVWQAMTDTYGSVGLKSTATQTRDGNVLKISDWQFTGTFPKQMGGSVFLSTTGLTLTENGDGTVSLTYPETMPISVALTLPDDNYATANFVVDQTGYTELLSGDPDNIHFEYAYDTLGLTIKNVDISDPDVDLSNLTGGMHFRNYTSTGTMRRGEMINIGQTYHAESVMLDFSTDIGGVEGKKGQMEYSARYENYGGTTNAQLPVGGVDIFNLPALLRAGMMAKGEMSIGQMATNMLVTLDGEIFQKQNISVSSTKTTAEFSKNGISILSDAKDYLVDMIDRNMPFPLKAQLPYVGVALEMPLLKSDAEQKFRVMYDFRDITISEKMWEMIDQITGTSFPHDPATLTFDVSGKGQLYYDLLDFEAMARISDSDEVPGDITSIAIDNLNIAAVGAALTASGAFDVNTKDLETFDGMPAIDGKANIKISGSNALLDRLAAMGVVEENEAMGARMMMGIFMKAGEGEDMLTSTIDVTKDGQVSANGQRLK